MELQLLRSVPGRLNEKGRAAGAVAIRTVGLTRVFGSHKAVDSVNLEVRTGEVFGFLGPNGAGKTTTINMILGLIRPTAGHVEIFGQKADWGCPALRRHVGSLLDGMRFYPYLSGRDNLRVFAAALDGIPSRRIDEVLDLVGLAGRARDKVRGYSHGMRRRLGLALALLHDPAVLVLDEPANGLDPAGIKEMRDLMKALAAQGKAVFLSSHLLHEVEIMCDRVAILRRGVMLAQGRVDELLGAAPAVEIAVDRPEEAERILRAQVGVPGVLDVPGVREARGVRGASSVDCVGSVDGVDYVDCADGAGSSGGVAGMGSVAGMGGAGDAGGANKAGSMAGTAGSVHGIRAVRRDGDRLVVEYVAAALDAGEAATAAGLDGRRVAHEGLEGAAYRAVAGRLNAALASQGIFAYEIRPRRAVLEDVFFEVLNGVHDGNNATHEGATSREDARR
ncbi:MAG: ATP-binding cassette domain-containing protein [Bacillota bacterium]|nr:ATP-binding cassette domain-containing protein [Bacillota bacterium]